MGSTLLRVERRRRKVDTGNELGQQGADPGVEVCDDAADRGLVLAGRVVDGPVEVADAGQVRAFLPQPRVIARSLAAMVSRVSGLGYSWEVSGPSFSSTSATSGWMCSPGWVPADSARTLPRAWCWVSRRLATDLPPSRTRAKTTCGT
jgi:hypothetical protein